MLPKHLTYSKTPYPALAYEQIGRDVPIYRKTEWVEAQDRRYRETPTASTAAIDKVKEKQQASRRRDYITPTEQECPECGKKFYPPYAAKKQTYCSRWCYSQSLSTKKEKVHEQITA